MKKFELNSGSLEEKIRTFDNKDVCPGIILPGQGG